jgi:hypothetical protein
VKLAKAEGFFILSKFREASRHRADVAFVTPVAAWIFWNKIGYVMVSGQPNEV